jgi:hypothetical protein
VSTDPTAAETTTRVTVVESEACHFCDDARAVLADLTDRYPLTIETVSVRSADGRELMARHRAALSPLVLLDGAFFSHGRLPRRRLIKVLQTRHGRPTGQTATKVG